MADWTDYYGISFEAGYSLFGDEFEEIPVVYIIHTSKKTLEIGQTINLKKFLEETDHAKDWVKLAEGDDVLVSFDLDEDEDSRKDKVAHLKSKMKSLIP